MKMSLTAALMVGSLLSGSVLANETAAVVVRRVERSPDGTTVLTATFQTDSAVKGDSTLGLDAIYDMVKQTDGTVSKGPTGDVKIPAGAEVTGSLSLPISAQRCLTWSTLTLRGTDYRLAGKSQCFPADGPVEAGMSALIINPTLEGRRPASLDPSIK